MGKKFKIFKLPDNPKTVALLELKLKEWELKLKIATDHKIRRELMCLLFIMYEIFSDRKEINTERTFNELKEAASINYKMFSCACNVIEDYLLNNGKNVWEILIKPLKPKKIKVG